ncbi:hypothetical protein D9756_006824 [Leucocoprinus leucothites]|uniref:Transcription activator of gluconeogenesis ERT1 n=1 Tax=Leucocoprinus leucothites TaxID=201217 RepID=A0A8H5G201_9AGAR|nr:hypothetical protein D9756_006824 [Leucoagaricus leucothites]
MMAFAPGMVYAYPPPPGTAFSPPASSGPPALGKPKRKQVKMACTNCAAACKRCDESRPCERCVKYGMSNSCIDGQRKERKKGIKRGPYKRKNKSDGPGAYPRSSILILHPPRASREANLLTFITSPSRPTTAALHSSSHSYSRTSSIPPEGFYPVYYGPPGPFLPHPPGAGTDAPAQQATNPDGSPAQPPPPPIPGHPPPPPVGVNGQPPAMMPPYFYSYPPFSHYPPMPFPPPHGMVPPPAAPPPTTGGAQQPVPSAAPSTGEAATTAPASSGGEVVKKDSEALNNGNTSPPPPSTASTSSIGPSNEAPAPAPTVSAPANAANGLAAAINAAATATGGKKRTRSNKVNGTNGDTTKVKRTKTRSTTTSTNRRLLFLPSL